jgi:hypothetical protein
MADQPGKYRIRVIPRPTRATGRRCWFEITDPTGDIVATVTSWDGALREVDAELRLAAARNPRNVTTF